MTNLVVTFRGKIKYDPEGETCVGMLLKLPEKIALIQPAIEAIMGEIARNHPDGFEAGLEELARGAMQENRKLVDAE